MPIIWDGWFILSLIRNPSISFFSRIPPLFSFSCERMRRRRERGKERERGRIKRNFLPFSPSLNPYNCNLLRISSAIILIIKVLPRNPLISLSLSLSVSLSFFLSPLSLLSPLLSIFISIHFINSNQSCVSSFLE